jgi:signal transduction histidine kinase
LEGDEHQQQYVLVQISDQGGGIPAEYVPRVFSRYAQADGKPIPGTAGKGASLAVVRALVENLGGRIWVDSIPGSGSTFSVLLPVSNGNTSEGGSTADPETEEGAQA